jgi:DNA (cytosine-5)-methyltransferase 1
MPDLTYAELFAGAGGLSAGLEMAGWEPVAHAEIEPHARAILRKHWPDCRLDGDVSQVNGTDYAGVTLLSGGSPCQDLSIAGKRSGMTEGSGTRSSLYFEQVRIWQESAAPYFLWENVLGALSSNAGRDFAAVLSALVGAPVPVPDDGWRGAGVASGPAGVAAWRVLDCQFFGPPQRRRRVFVLGARAGGVDPAQVLLECDRLCGDTASSGEAREGVAADTGIGVAPTLDAGDPIVFAQNSRDEVREVPNGVVCALAAQPGMKQTNYVIQPEPAVLRSTIPLDVRNATRTTDASEQNRQGLGVGKDGDPSPTLTGLFTPAVLVTTQYGDVAGTLSARADGSPCADRGPNMVLAYDDRNQAATETTHHTAVILRNREGKDGGGKGPLLSAERSLTLGTSNDQVVFTSADLPIGTICNPKSWSVQEATSGMIHPTSTGIPRRLMPVECERLMGWADDWTAVGINEQGEEYALSDTARYRLCGNGVASPVAGFIGWMLREAIEREA